MSHISPFHNAPNPFASFLFGFPTISENSGPRFPGDVPSPFGDEDEPLTLESLAQRISALETGSKQTSQNTDFASIMSSLS